MLRNHRTPEEALSLAYEKLAHGDDQFDKGVDLLLEAACAGNAEAVESLYVMFRAASRKSLTDGTTPERERLVGLSRKIFAMAAYYEVDLSASNKFLSEQPVLHGDYDLPDGMDIE